MSNDTYTDKIIPVSSGQVSISGDMYIDGNIQIRGSIYETNFSTTINNTYTINDNDNINYIFCNPTARAFAVNLPTLADNLGRTLRVKVIAAGGAVSLTPEGAETIDGVNAAFVMQSSGDHCTVVGQTTGWRILSAYAKLDTGWIQRNAWTNEHLGSAVVTYNAGAGAFIIGELITESVSNNTGIIIADTGAVLTLKNVTGSGVFTNARTLTGTTSACARTVNGSTIGVDSNFVHNFGQALPNLSRLNSFISSDKAEATTIRHSSYNYASEGVNHWGVDTNSIIIQTGSANYGYLAANGVGTAAGGNWYYKIVAGVII